MNESINQVEVVKQEVMPGFCQCGCGGVTNVFKKTCVRDGKIKGTPARFILGHHSRGNGNNKWKGGKTTGGTKGKYVHLYMPNHPRSHHGHVAEHILIAERVLGKPLPPGAVLHHVNHNETDNRNCNLVICENQGYHRILHIRQRRIEDERNRTSAI